jgi:hypothetical protein
MKGISAVGYVQLGNGEAKTPLDLGTERAKIIERISARAKALKVAAELSNGHDPAPLADGHALSYRGLDALRQALQSDRSSASPETAPRPRAEVDAIDGEIADTISALWPPKRRAHITGRLHGAAQALGRQSSTPALPKCT